MHQLRVPPPRRQRQISHRERIHREGRLWIVFRFIDTVEGRAVEQNIRGQAVHHRIHLRAVADIDFFSIHRNHFMAREHLAQIGSQLSQCADEQNLHTPSLSHNRLSPPGSATIA
jgi:uncharacterized membrane protein YccC